MVEVHSSTAPLGFGIYPGKEQEPMLGPITDIRAEEEIKPALSTLHACIHCHASKTACTDQRPCPRCIRLGLCCSSERDQPRKRACQGCHAGKVACEMLPGDSSCLRCQRLGIPCVLRSSPLSAPDATRKRRRLVKPLAKISLTRAHQEADMSTMVTKKPIGIPTKMHEFFALSHIPPQQAAMPQGMFVKEPCVGNNTHSVACSLLDLANGSTSPEPTSSSAGSSPLSTSPPPPPLMSPQIHPLLNAQMHLDARPPTLSHIMSEAPSMMSPLRMQVLAPPGLLHPVPRTDPAMAHGMVHSMAPGMAQAMAAPGIAQGLAPNMNDFLNLDASLIPHLGQVAAQQQSLPYFQTYQHNNMHNFVTTSPYQPMPHKLLMGWS